MKLLIIIIILLLLFTKGRLGDISKLKVAVITEGSPNDLGYNFQINQGAVEAGKALKSTSINYYGNISSSTCESFIKELIEVRGYVAIFGPSPQHTNCIIKSSSVYLNNYFIYTGIVKYISNRTMAVSYNSELLEYVCGFFAGTQTVTNKLGYIGPGPPLLNNFPSNAFYTGAYSANPNITLDYYTTGSWIDPEVSKAATKELLKKGIDYIGQNLQDMSVSLAVYESGMVGLGSNGFNQSKIFGVKIPFSYVLNWKTCFLIVIEAAYNNSTISLEGLYRGDLRNKFIEVVIDPSLGQEKVDLISGFVSFTFSQPRSKLYLFCNNFVDLLFSGISISGCLAQQYFYNMTDPYPEIHYYGNYTLPTHLVKFSENVTKTFIVITLIFVVTSIFLAFLIIIFKEKPTFRFASPTFCVLIIIGGVIVYGGIIVWVLPVTKVTCNLRYWLVSEGITILIGSLVIKNFRIWLIFDNPELKTIRITNLQLFPWIFILIITNSFLLVIISYRGGSEVINIYNVDNLNKFEYLQTCSMNQIGFISLYVLLCYFGVLLTVGLFVSWKIRIVDIPEFNESKPIANTLYTISFCLTISASLIASPQTYENQTIILCISGLFITTSTLFILFVPKLLNLNSHYFAQNRQSIISTLRYISSKPHLNSNQPNFTFTPNRYHFAEFTDDTASRNSKKSTRNSLLDSAISYIS